MREQSPIELLIQIPNHLFVFPAFMAGISNIAIRSICAWGALGDTGREGRYDVVKDWKFN